MLKCFSQGPHPSGCTCWLAAVCRWLSPSCVLILIQQLPIVGLWCISKCQCQEAASVHLLMSYSHSAHSCDSKARNTVCFFPSLSKRLLTTSLPFSKRKLQAWVKAQTHHSPSALTPSWRVLWFPEYGPWGSKAWTFQWGTGCGGPWSAPGRTPGTRAGTGRSTAAALLKHRGDPPSGRAPKLLSRDGRERGKSTRSSSSGVILDCFGAWNCFLGCLCF